MEAEGFGGGGVVAVVLRGRAGSRRQPDLLDTLTHNMRPSCRNKFLIRDRDSKFTEAFDEVIAGNSARLTPAVSGHERVLARHRAAHVAGASPCGHRSGGVTTMPMPATATMYPRSVSHRCARAAVSRATP